MYTLFFTMGPSTHHPLSSICELSSSMDISAFPLPKLGSSSHSRQLLSQPPILIMQLLSSLHLQYPLHLFPIPAALVLLQTIWTSSQTSLSSQSLDIFSFIHPLPVIFLVNNLIMFFPCLKTFPGSFWSTK